MSKTTNSRAVWAIDHSF